jgi:hypothetical protein
MCNGKEIIIPQNKTFWGHDIQLILDYN